MSSDDFNKDWRFRIDKDFVKPSGEAYEYADHGLKEWGSEFLNIPFAADTPRYGPRSAAISPDVRYIAINNRFDILVYEIIGSQRVYTLQGHVSEVDAIMFRPGHPHQLVTVGQNNMAGSVPAEPEIILWDLHTVARHRPVDAEDIEHVARNAANAVIAELKQKPLSFDLTARDQKSLAESMKPSIAQLVRSKSRAPKEKIFGRLCSDFQADVFSQSGKFMLYMPGHSPRSNGDDDWQLRLASFESPDKYTLLSGNRDAIMWTGFNHDESLVGTACWDKSFRIWDTKHGHQKYVWRTDNQNWTGGFSPNGKQFAGTSGDGVLHVYNLLDGSEHMKLNGGASWPRSLSWHPTMPLIALGMQGSGRLSLIDIEDKEAIQVRTLSVEGMKRPEKYAHGAGSFFLEVVSCQFVDGGRKIAFMTSGDGSAEVYDIHDGLKWRFARAGTMNAPDDDEPVTSQSGYKMIVHEDRGAKQVVLLTVDTDAIRVWLVPTSSKD